MHSNALRREGPARSTEKAKDLLGKWEHGRRVVESV